MKLYHGTNSFFEEFSNEYLSTKDSIDQYGSGFYFYSNPAKTVLHGDMRVTANVEIKKSVDHAEQWDVTYDDIESLVFAAPDLDNKLTNFGDIDHEGYDRILNKAISVYVEKSFYTDILNLLGNDFYDSEDTHILLKRFTEITGIDCFTDLKREIYVILTKQQIDVQSIVHEQEWEEK